LSKPFRFPLAFFLFIAALFSGCYSFTGASIPAYLHTIGIPNVEDNSGFGQSAIPQNLTNQLIQKFTSDGSFRVATPTSADARLEVSIPANGVIDEPVNVNANQIVTTKQVTLRAHAIYTDQKKQKQFWERDFTETAQYQIAGGLGAQQSALVQAEQNLSQDILIAVISNW
jgi:hypothetical protein